MSENQNLQGCENCEECKNCENCNDCTKCSRCDNCNNCTYCYNCDDCDNCEHCNKSTKCKNCVGCDNCFECINCRNCDNCYYSSGLKGGPRALERKCYYFLNEELLPEAYFEFKNGKKVGARQALDNGHIRVIGDKIYYDNRIVSLHNNEIVKNKFTHKNIEEYDDVIFVSGKFFIGDPGHTMGIDDWYEYVLKDRFHGIYDEIYKKINYDVNDAVYYDQWGNMYDVDCEKFGISCVDNLDDCKIEHLKRLGVIVDVKEVIHTYFVDKTILHRNDADANCNSDDIVKLLKIVIDNNDEYLIDFIIRR